MLISLKDAGKDAGTMILVTAWGIVISLTSLAHRFLAGYRTLSSLSDVDTSSGTFSGRIALSRVWL